MKFLRILFNIISQIRKDNIFIYSAHASYYIIISAIPFIMLLLSFSRFILPLTESELLEIALPLLPKVIHPVAKTIIAELFYKPSASAISITAASALWTASRGVAAIERGIAKVYKKPHRSSFLLLIVSNILHTLGFIFIILLITILSALGVFLARKSGISVPFSLLRWILTPAVLILLLTLVYMMLSGNRKSFTLHLPGAVFTAGVWILASAAFSFYINHFANYSYIYGSLSVIILMLLWIYLCTIILLLGAELNILLRRQQKRAP